MNSRIKKFFTIIILVVLSSYFIIIFSRSTSIFEDVSKHNNITLKTNKEELVHGIYLKLIGDIDGNATIKISNSEKQLYSYQISRGKVSMQLGGDWYDNICTIEYIPDNVTQGNLKIVYEFFTFKNFI